MGSLKGTATRREVEKDKPITTKELKGIAQIIKALEKDYNHHKEGEDKRSREESALYEHFHVAIRPALYWVRGDPFTATFPKSYVEQYPRLPKLCAWLKGVRDLKKPELVEWREKQVSALRKVFPAYAELCGGTDYPLGATFQDDELQEVVFSWESLTDTWEETDAQAVISGKVAEGKVRILPAMTIKAAEDFYLAAMAVLFLNRELGLILSDLHSYPWELERTGVWKKFFDQGDKV